MMFLRYSKDKMGERMSPKEVMVEQTLEGGLVSLGGNILTVPVSADFG